MAGHYRLDPLQTEVRFKTRRLFGLAEVTGSVKLREGEITIGAPASATTVSAVLDADSFNTGLGRRDTRVRSSKFLDTAAFPDIVFTASLVDRTDGEWVAVGVVTAHGVSAPVDVTVSQINAALGGEVALHATATIDRQAHHVSAAWGMAARRLDIDITALATR